MLEKNKNKENKRLIPLRRFAKVGPYGSAYLSNLVQRKRLKAKKIGRNYFTTQEWFSEYLEMHAQEGKRQATEVKKKELLLVPQGKPTATKVLPVEREKEPETISSKKEKPTSVKAKNEEIDFEKSDILATLNSTGEKRRIADNWPKERELKILATPKIKLNFNSWKIKLTAASLIIFQE